MELVTKSIGKKKKTYKQKLMDTLDRVSVELHGTYSQVRVDELDTYLKKAASNPITTNLKIASVAVILPSLAIAVLYVVNVLIPLSSTTEGVEKNSAFLKRSALEVFAASSEIVVMLNAQLPDLKLGFVGILIPALVYASIHYIQIGILPYILQDITSTDAPWFPLPYTIHITAPVCWIFTAITLVFFIRNPVISRLSTYVNIPERWPRLRNYIILETVQFLIIMVYTSYGILNKIYGDEYPILMTLILVSMKFGGKMIISSLSERFTSDTSPMLVVFTAELFNAIYTSFALQSSKSNYTVIGMLIFIDVLQNILYLYNFYKYRKDSSSLPKTTSFDSMARIASTSSSTTSKIKPKCIPEEKSVRFIKQSTRHLDCPPPNTELRARFLSISEHLVLTEYVEIIVPIIYTAFLTIMYGTSNKKYYDGLRSFEFTLDDYYSAVTSLAILALLEALSFFMLYVILKAMVNINAFHHLGFVLKKHFMLGVVTLTMWLILTTGFRLDHNGCDLTFQFPWLK